MRRSNADKRKVVTRLLKDEEWSEWSDREIARQCKVDHKTVAKIRKDLTEEIPSEEPDERTYIDKHGKKSKMKTGLI